MSECDKVIIMGHSNPDIDAMGSALGIYRIAISLRKEAYILTDKSHEEYAGRYILTHSKQLFTKQTEFFTLTTILAFKKVVK